MSLWRRKVGQRTNQPLPTAVIARELIFRLPGSQIEIEYMSGDLYRVRVRRLTLAREMTFVAELLGMPLEFIRQALIDPLEAMMQWPPPEFRGVV